MNRRGFIHNALAFAVAPRLSVPPATAIGTGFLLFVNPRTAMQYPEVFDQGHHVELDSYCPLDVAYLMRDPHRKDALVELLENEYETALRCYMKALVRGGRDPVEALA